MGRWAGWVAAAGFGLAVGGIVMGWWWDRMSVVDPEPGYFWLVERGFVPVFCVGLLVMAAGCVALSREWRPKRNYWAAAVGLGAVPLMAGVLKAGWLRFGEGAWVMMVLVLLVTVFALGCGFLVAAVSWRKWE